MAGTGGRNVEAGAEAEPWRSVVYWLATIVHWTRFPTQYFLPRENTTHSELDAPTSITQQENIL